MNDFERNVGKQCLTVLYKNLSYLYCRILCFLSKNVYELIFINMIGSLAGRYYRALYMSLYNIKTKDFPLFQ